MHRMLSITAAVGTAVLLGCEPSSLRPITPTDEALRNAGAGVVQSATGSGHYTTGGEIRTLAFSAVKRADGSVSGEYQINVHASDLFFHVTVTCMDVVGNTAWIAGIIDKASGPPVVEGTVSYFYAIDGGEGPDAVDIVSVARINDRPESAQEFCTQHPMVLPPRTVEKGNVQVRD
jgi:hypothetical protein